MPDRGTVGTPGRVPTERPPLHLRIPAPAPGRSDGAPWRAVTVEGLHERSTIGELAAALGPADGSPAPARVVVDGRPVPSTASVGAAGICHGSTVAPAPPADTVAPVVWVVTVAGPDTGRVVALPPGRHVLGSGPGAGCRIADPGVAAHHAVLEVAADGGTTISDLGVGRPVLVGGRTGDGACPVAPRVRVVVGATVFVIQRPVDRPPVLPAREPSGDPWAAAVHRRATPAVPRPTPLRPPQVAVGGGGGGPTGVGLASLATTVLTGVGAAILFRQPVMLILALLGAVGALAVTGWQTLRHRRDEARRARVDAQEWIRFETDVARRAHDERIRRSRRMPWLVVGGRSLLRDPWQLRRSDAEAWAVGWGLGDVEWVPVLDGGPGALCGRPDGVNPAAVRLRDVMVPFALVPGTVVGLVGPPADRCRVARAVVLQRAVALGPADLAVVVVTERPEEWSWAEWLPHRVTAEAGIVLRPASVGPLVDELTESNEPGRHDVRAGGPSVVLVIDGDHLLAGRDAPARRLLDRIAPTGAAVVLTDPAHPVPAVCTAALQIAGPGTAELLVFRDVAGSSVVGPGQVQRVHPIGVSAATAQAVAASLAGRSDPERTAGSGRLPVEVDLLSVLGDEASSADAIAEGWRTAGSDPPARARIGRSADGCVELDLVADGPHALVAGTTGAGKSELLRTWVTALAVASPPELLSFVLVDYKGGSAFDACAGLPHVVGVVTDLDHRLGGRVLRSLDAELKHRERTFRAAGAADLTAYRALGDDTLAPVARLVVIVDEFATLAAELPEFLSALVSVAQRGRSLGVHLVLATQRPAGVLSDEIRANTNLRLALRVQDPGDSQDVVGDRSAARLPRGRPGRAIARLGAEERVEFQTARATAGVGRPADRGLRVRPMGDPAELPGPAGPDGAASARPTALDVLVGRITAAARARGTAAVRRPWCDPLPVELTTLGPEGGEPDGNDVVGLIDLVAEPRRLPLRWRRADGHLLVAGAVGSGVTSTLVGVAAAAVAADPGRVVVYAIDGAATGELDELAAHAWCVGVVGGDQPERIGQLLTRLETEHRNPGPGAVGVVVIIDGLASLRSRLGTPDLAELGDRLDQLVVSGGALRFVFGAERPTALPVAWAGGCGQRWIGRVSDPIDVMSAGYPAAAALPLGSPAGRFLVERYEGVALEAQVLAPRAARERAATASRATIAAGGPPIGRLVPLPAQLSSAELDVQPTAGPGCLRLPVGRRVADLGVAFLELHDGDHLTVTGPARSGRSTLLHLLGEQWRVARPDGVVEYIDARRRQEGAVALARHAAAPDRPLLLLVDDADRFDDADGTLAGMIGADRPGLTVVAAGRPEALRGVGYGHWTGLVRRGRRGLLLGAVQDLDADVLGVHLPRRVLPRGAVPIGRAVVVADGRHEAVQLALPRAPRECGAFSAAGR